MNPLILYDLLLPFFRFIQTWDREWFFTSQKVVLDPVSICIYNLYIQILYIQIDRRMDSHLMSFSSTVMISTFTAMLYSAE